MGMATAPVFKKLSTSNPAGSSAKATFAPAPTPPIKRMDCWTKDLRLSEEEKSAELFVIVLGPVMTNASTLMMEIKNTLFQQLTLFILSINSNNTYTHSKYE